MFVKDFFKAAECAREAVRINVNYSDDGAACYEPNHPKSVWVMLETIEECIAPDGLLSPPEQTIKKSVMTVRFGSKPVSTDPTSSPLIKA